MSQSLICTIILVFFALLTISDALQFKPISTRAGLNRTAIALESLPTVTNRPLDDDLRKRQTVAQDATCGWINGNAASIVSCPSNFYCATQQSYVGCCALTSCAGIVTTCYDILGSICDAACQKNIGNLVCPSSLPYYGTYIYPGESVGYGCRDATGYTVSVLLSTTTSDGGRLTLSISTSSSSRLSTTSSASASTIFLTPSATPTLTPAVVKNGLGAGPIAGIALGTIATIVFVGAIFFWMITTHRRNHLAAQRPKPPPDSYEMRSQPGQQYPMTSHFYPKEELQGSPPLGQRSPTSFLGSDISGGTPRNSQRIWYTGPTMAEMHGDHVERR